MGSWRGLHNDSKSPYRGMSHDEMVDAKRVNRMDSIDRLDPETRALVHEYGYHVVTAIRELGVTKPKHIRHIVETVLNEFSPTRGSCSVQGKRSGIKE